MNEQIPEKMNEFLRRAEIQERIRQRILLIRRQVTAPIGVAVDLTGLSENQLRKWEEKGLLNPQREGNHRYYSPQDLDKLVLIQELIEAKFPLSSIPFNIDMVWRAITALDGQLSPLGPEIFPPAIGLSETASHQHIDQRIKGARPNLFWYYYASHALRLSLYLIREGIPVIEDAGIGLILPLHGDSSLVNVVKHVDKLPLLGESLVGWLALSGSSQTMLAPAPSFSNPNLYRLYQLRPLQEGVYVEDDEPARALLVTNWKFDNLTLEPTTVSVIRRLCAPLYENAQNIRSCFSPGWRDVLDPATKLDDEYTDYILNGLADMVVRLQTTNTAPQSRGFCYILVPTDSLLPLQRRSLIVRAQSSNAPDKVGRTFVTPGDITLSISLRAYQSGQIIYRSDISEEDIALASDPLQNPASTIVIPVEGVNDTPSALLYLVSDEPYTFNSDDQRVLRLIGRMVQEVLSTYKARYQASEQLTNVIRNPDVIDTFFKQKGILPEDQFVQDIEILLKNIQTKFLTDRKDADRNIALPGVPDASMLATLSSTDVLSLISLEIDDQARLARLYGDQFSQNLCKSVGSRLQIQLRRILADSISYNIYFSCSGGFYLLLNGLPLQEARKHADNIRRHLNHDYEVSILHSANKKIATSDPESKRLEHISVHVAVNSYTYKKLGVLLERYPITNPAEKVRVLIGRDMDTALSKGRIEGGNVVISWDPEPYKRYIHWSP